MKRALFAAVVLLAALRGVAASAETSSFRPDAVMVTDEWEGMSSSQKYEIRYSFRAATNDYRSGKLILTLETVQRTIQQIAGHAHLKADAASIGVTELWLRDTLPHAMNYCLHLRPSVPKAVFSREYLRSAEAVMNLIGSVASVDLSEHIAVTFEVHGRGGVEITSNATVPFRIPWTVTGAMGSFQSFDPQLSRDIAQLTPLSSRDLRGEFMQTWYENAVCNFDSIARYYP